MATGASANNSSNTTVTCSQAIDPRIFKLGCLGPALAIIVLLACLKRRKHFKLEYCNGYPGLLTPINFLRGRHNRFTIAATFGATASTCMELFFSEKTGMFIEGGPPWVKVFQAIITILVYGILFYPLFACMTTDHRLVGSLVGFLYVSVWFSFGVAIDFQCINSFGSISSVLMTVQIISGLPTYICLIFIVIRFAVLLCVEVQRKWFHSSREPNKGTEGIAGEPEIVHVRKLFNSVPSMSSAEVKWYMKAIYFFYKPRTDFKFSTQFVSTLLVAFIAVFEVTVACIGFLDLLKKISRPLCKNDFCLEFLGVFYGSLQAAGIISALISVISLLHFIKCHRDHVLQLYRGQRTVYQGVDMSPAKLVGRSLRFSGYQIAHTLAGYVILSIFLAFVCVFLAIIFKYVKIFLSPEMWNAYKQMIIAFLPTVSMVVFLVVFQLFLAHFVFRNRDFPDITVTVDNRRLFSIMSYFFFFYNVIVGLFACVIRILKGMILGTVFLSRIDRTSLMQGFQTLDQAFVAYLGFINVLVAHSHPVMLVFCQLLIKRNKDRWLEESLPQIQPLESDVESDEGSCYTRENRLPRMTCKAANRWHVAVTLLRNPSLIKYRKQGGQRILHFENLGSINNDDLSALV
ncbi:stimulated by retinoic acid gene 6 protein-like isoform X1 [Porites lutea]|uniref:stimulated by retinoic acid gene 6 protein-like isoform X1 n=1 Tax=Porites lutea TaxID=51062 RepID=UPI003CC6C498